MTNQVSIAEKAMCYERVLVETVNNRIEKFREYPQFMQLIHQLADKAVQPHLVELEEPLITKAYYDFVDRRMRAVHHAGKLLLGLDATKGLPRGSVVLHHPEHVAPESRQNISGGVTTPFQYRDRDFYFSVMGYYLKARDDDGSEMIARYNGQRLTFPVAYIVPVSAEDTQTSEMHRYFPNKNGYPGNASAEWKAPDIRVNTLTEALVRSAGLSVGPLQAA